MEERSVRNRLLGPLEALGRLILDGIVKLGQVLQFFGSSLLWLVRPPLRVGIVLKQMEFVGVKSLFVVVLTATFTGMVIALQSYTAFSKFNAESMVGATVALSLCRELGPVLTGLIVTGRAGSAMAAELGTMRVTEQIDALSTMAVDPINYLVVPRVLAAIVMLPALTVIFDFMGILGGYFVGAGVLNVSGGSLVASMVSYTDYADLTHGLYKSAVFGFILSMVGCYKGYFTAKGAEGVGRATTEAVVLSSVLILVSDYFLTDLLF